MLKDAFLKKNKIDAHSLKTDFVGKKHVSHYDIYRSTNDGELWIFRKGGKGDGIPTSEFID